MNTMGRCPQCGKQIGARTANGIFRYFNGQYQQIQLVYGYNRNVRTQVTEKDAQGNEITREIFETLKRPEKTKVHVVLCTACANNIKVDELGNFLYDNEENFREFKKSAPEAIFEKAEKVSEG